MSNQRLSHYVFQALRDGKDAKQIQSTLQQAGWSEAAIKRELSRWRAQDNETPLPLPAPSSLGVGLRYVIMLFLLFFSLYHFASLGFFLVDHYAGTPIKDLTAAETVRWSLACLLVSFPLLFWLAARQQEQLVAAPDHFAPIAIVFHRAVWGGACAVLAACAVVLIYELFSGGLSGARLLKLALLAGLLAVISWYSLKALRSEPPTGTPGRKALLAAAVLVSLTSALALAAVATPAQQKAQLADEQRIADLEYLSNLVRLHKAEFGQLPSSLDQLTMAGGTLHDLPRDPDSATAYHFTQVDADSFRLCAEFVGHSRDSDESFWRYEPGYHCFQLLAP